MEAHDYEYEVALSYASEDREYADILAKLLKSQGVEVFYDQYKKPDLWGKNLYTHLSDLYQNKALYCVIFISQHYARKVWTRHELQAAQARALTENQEYILPIRLDDTEILGIPSTIAYLNWHNETPEYIADAILEKLRDIRHPASSEIISGENKSPETKYNNSANKSKIIFVLGRPGSGKSTASRYIADYAKMQSWATTRLNDYKILYQMFLEERENTRFQSTGPDGFKIIDNHVLDESLQILQQSAIAAINSSVQSQLIIIEFARNDYRESLKMFGSSLLKNSRFLFIDADIHTCLERIQKRVINPKFADDTYISNEVVKTYYSIDNWEYMALELPEEYETHNNTIIISNTGALELFETRVAAVARFILSDRK